MKKTIEAAERATRDILEAVDAAREALVRASRTNAIGVLHVPHGAAAEMKSARDAIDRALAVHARTQWPTDQDYDIL